jgi:circadian clock protein KaiB
MDHADSSAASATPLPGPDDPTPCAQIRLYIARSTPNSVRAERNFCAALDALADSLVPPTVEIIDVFAQPRRAITDGVVVTPTLIGVTARSRIVLMGDLADTNTLLQAIRDLIAG